MFIKLDREYKVKTTWCAIKEIERVFNRPFYTMAGCIMTMHIQEQIKFLFNGVKLSDPCITQKVFNQLCKEYLDNVDVKKYLEQFVYNLQCNTKDISS